MEDNEQKVGLVCVGECAELEQVQGFKCEKQKMTQAPAVGIWDDNVMTAVTNHTQTW